MDIKKRIRFVQSCATMKAGYSASKEYEVDGVEADALVKAGYAIPVGDQPKAPAPKPEPEAVKPEAPKTKAK